MPWRKFGLRWRKDLKSNGLFCWQRTPFVTFENHGDLIKVVLKVGAALWPCLHFIPQPEAQVVTKMLSLQVWSPSATQSLTWKGWTFYKQRFSFWRCPWPGSELLILWVHSALSCPSTLVTGNDPESGSTPAAGGLQSWVTALGTVPWQTGSSPLHPALQGSQGTARAAEKALCI